MRFEVACDLEELGRCVPKFLSHVGNDRWLKRVSQLEDEQRASPYRWRIVLDYHWLEMDLAHQADILQQRGDLDPVHVDSHALVCLQFASAVVNIHGQLSGKGQRVLEGGLRDALNAETGFAALFLEVDLARRLMAMGYDVQWPDMDGTGQFDLMFEKGTFVAEMECKSLSADAGRQIHRKDFYRLVEFISPALDAHLQGLQQLVVSVTLRNRLSPDLGEQDELRRLVVEMLAVAAEVILTHCAEVKVTHLGEDDGLFGAVDVDPGASSGDPSDGPKGRRGEVDRQAAELLAQHRAAIFA